MKELVLMVPTYYGAAQVNPEWFPDKEEFDDPRVPVLVRDAEGVHVVLGTSDSEDFEKPDIQIERRPNGWAIFLHPVGGGDASGFVYFLDDGRSFLIPDGLPSERINVLDCHEPVPMIDEPPPPPIDQNRFPGCPKLSAVWVQAQTALRGDSNDDEHDALLALVEALETVEVGFHQSDLSADATPHVVFHHTENVESEAERSRIMAAVKGKGSDGGIADFCYTLGMNSSPSSSPSYIGHFKNGVVIFDAPIALKDGQPVRVEPLALETQESEPRRDDQVQQLQALFAKWTEEDGKLSDEEADRLQVALEQNRGLGFRPAHVD